MLFGGNCSEIDSLSLDNSLSFDPLEPQELRDGFAKTFPYCSPIVPEPEVWDLLIMKEKNSLKRKTRH